MATKNVVVNKIFNKYSHEFVNQLFKPSWSPKRADQIEAFGTIKIEEKPLYGEQTKLNQPFFLPNVAASSSKLGTFPSMYNPFDGASNLFLATYDFLTFLDLLVEEVSKLGSDTFIQWAYNSDGSINYAASAVDSMLEQFNGTLAVNEALFINDPRFDSTDMLEFFLRHFYSLNIEARNAAFDIIGVRFGIEIQAQKAKKGFIPFTNFNPDLLQTELQDDGLITYSYTQPIALERRYDKEQLSTEGVNTDKLFLFFPSIQDGKIEGYVPQMYYTKNDYIGRQGDSTGSSYTYNYHVPYWSAKFYSESATVAANTGLPVYKKVAPYVALSLGSVAENADTANALAPYDIVVDHSDKLDYLDNLIFNINSPKRYK